MLRRFSFAVACLVVVGAPGACDCGPEPVKEIVCDFTVSTTSGDRIDFGTVQENGGTRSGTVVIKNTGTAALSSLSATFAANSEHYSITLPAGLSLVPDEQQAFVVVFAPRLRTILNSELQIGHPDFGGKGCPTRTLTLLGEGVDALPVDGGFDPDAGVVDGGNELEDGGVVDGGFIDTPDGGIIFDPDNEWRAYGGFEEARAGFATVALNDGTILAIGGWGENGTVLDSIERFDPVAGRSQIVARMPLGRAEPGAVALDANRVAIVGGRSARSGGVVVRTVEIFNVATNTLSCPGTQAESGACSDNTRGFLAQGRINPVVSALSATEIVVALGRIVDSNIELAFAGGEIVNLISGTVTPLIGLSARTGEARLVDDDGSFFVVGGTTATGALLTRTDRFSATTRLVGAGPVLPAARTFAGIARLQGDRAIVVGGANGAGVAVADPLLIEGLGGSAVITPITTTMTPRVSPDLASLPGDVVVIAGGLAAAAANDDDDSVVPLTSGEILVPFGAGFARFAPDNELAQGRIGAGVVVTDGELVTWLGGFGTAPRRTPHPHAEQYRLFDNTFASFGLMGAGAAWAPAATPAGAALVAVGGVDPHTGATSARSRAFAAETGTFFDASPLQSPRRDHSATSIAADLVVVIGGRDATGAVVGSASILNVNSGDTPLPVSLRRPRAGHTATLLNTDGPAQVLVCGGVGVGGELLDSCEVFTAPTDPRSLATFASSSFAVATGRMATGRLGHTATLLDSGEVLLVGGGDVERAQVAADLFVPAQRSIVRAGVPDRARRHHAAVALGAGRVLLVGGEVFEGGLGPSRRAEVYVRATNAFVAVEDLRTARLQPAAFLLGDGNVLIAGGTRTLAEAGFPTISVVESELYVAGATGVGTFEAIELPLSFGRSDLIQADVFGRAVVVGGTHRDGVLRSGDERRSPQHFVDVLEPLDD